MKGRAWLAEEFLEPSNLPAEIPKSPLDFPTLRIDFVFYTPELVALSTMHGEFGGSDQRPMVAELAFRDR